MELNEILDRIDEILDREKKLIKGEQDENAPLSFMKEVVILLFQFLITVVKTPFRFVAGYVKKELLAAIKKDSKLMAVISAMLIVLLVFFLVFWFSLSAAVGIYFYEEGNTLFVSALYSLAFQVLSSVLTGLTAYVSFRRLKTFKIYKSIARKH
jgi:magnesium-transporting ATPase (P-type)